MREREGKCVRVQVTQNVRTLYTYAPSDRGEVTSELIAGGSDEEANGIVEYSHDTMRLQCVVSAESDLIEAQ